MRFVKRAGIIVSLLFWLSLVGPSPSFAQEFRGEVEQLTKGADYICIAKVKSIESSWYTNNTGDRFIYSKILLDIEESIKGSLGQQREIVSIGGTIGNLVSHPSFASTFRDDERVFLFLKGHEGVLQPYRFSHGKYHIDKQGLIQTVGLPVEGLKREVEGVLRQTRLKTSIPEGQTLKIQREKDEEDSFSNVGGCSYRIPGFFR